MNAMIHGIDGWGCKRTKAAVDTSSITPAWAKAVYRQQQATIEGLRAMKLPGDEPADTSPGATETADAPADATNVIAMPLPRSSSATAKGRDHRREELDRLIEAEGTRSEKTPKLPCRPSNNEGVSKISKTGWRGRIRLGGKDVFSQTFRSRDEAVAAVRLKRVELGIVAGEKDES